MLATKNVRSVQHPVSEMHRRLDSNPRMKDLMMKQKVLSLRQRAISLGYQGLVE